MGKALIIAEKPSVAADIARALGGFTRHDDYFESDDYVLSSAVGHLLEIGMPEDEEVKRGKWTFAHLPAIPSHFALKPIEKNEVAPEDAAASSSSARTSTALDQRLRRRTRRRAHLPLHRRSTRRPSKPIQRLWLQSMTPAAIRDGFAQLRSDEEMLPLADAARLPLRSPTGWSASTARAR